MIKEKLDKYLAGHIEQIAREEEEIKALSRQALEKAQLIAVGLVEKYQVSRVYLFGSLARGDFRLDSDIDLALEGLPEELFLKAYGLAEAQAEPFKVDLVLLEGALKSLRECVFKEGQLLYDLKGEKDSSPKKA